MADISQGNRAELILNPGDVYRVSTGGVATVESAYGAPAGTTTVTAASQDFGPYLANAKLIVRAVTGSASYIVRDLSSGMPLYDKTTGRWLGVIDKAGNEQLVESVYGPVQDFGSTSGARAINCEKGDVCSLTIAGPTTLSFTNLPTYNTSLRVTLVITNGGSSVTWPAGSRWAGPGVVGSAPTLAATGVDKVVMEINNIAGTIYYDAAYIGRVA